MNQPAGPSPNAIVHFDICGPQEQDLHHFYGGLLGWKVQPQGPGYALVDTPSGLRGAIADAGQAAITLGVAVPDLAAALRNAEKLGGSVVMPPTDNGWIVKAQVKDPAGNLLTLIQMRTQRGSRELMVLAVLIVLGVLVVLIAVVLVTGRLLPVKHQAGRRVELRQSPQAVWDVITDVQGLPAWRPGVTRVELLPEQAGRQRWCEYDRHNKITFEVAEAVVPTRLVTRITDPDLPFGGTWTYEIAPSPDGCTVTVTEDGEVYSPLFRFVSRFVIGHTATLDRNLKALVRHFGESAPIHSA